METTSRGSGLVSSYYDSHGQWQVCFENDRNVGSYGVFNGDSPFEFVLPVTLCQLFTIILISRTMHFLLRPLRTPKFICNLLGGIILGPTCLGRNKTYWNTLFPPRQREYLVLTSLIGAVHFVFLVSLKMDVIMSTKAAKSTWRLGVIPFLASFGVMVSLLSLYHNPEKISSANITIANVSVSFVMSLSNFPVVSDAMSELNLTSTELGQIALSSSMINDLILWILVAMLRFTSENEVKNKITLLFIWFLFISLHIFVLRPTMKLIARTTPAGKPVKEVYVVLILLGSLIMAAVGDIIGITFLMGPLIYGLIIPTKLVTTLVEKSEFILTEFLLPYFFVYIGINTNLSALQDWRLFLTLQGVFFTADLAKLFACVLVSLTYNIRPKHGTVLGLTLNIKGIIQLIGLARLRKIQMLDEDTYSQLVCCVAIITAIATPIVNFMYKHRPRVLSTKLYEGQVKTIQSNPRNTEFRIICCVHNEENVSGATALIERCNPVVESPICVYAVHLVELIGKSSPIFLPLKYRQNKKSLSVNYPNTNHIMRAFENYANNSSGPVKILPYVNVAPYKSMHDAIFNLAQDEMVPFIIIPFHENNNFHLVGHMASAVRKMNTTFQAHVPCTLGIIVDKYSRLGDCNNPNLLFNVGVFFIGGPDDREALALGIRMSEHANMRVSLFRFIIINKKASSDKLILTREELEEEEEDAMLDEGLIDEFKNMKYRNGNVSCYDIMVKDGIEVLDAVHSLEGNYDLVMVGRCHSDGSLNGHEMATFIENAEILGILGDMLCSTEFCIGMIPVLVTQCGGVRLNSNKLDRMKLANASQRSLTGG